MVFLQNKRYVCDAILRSRVIRVVTLLEPQSRFGDKPVIFQAVCPQNGTAVLKGIHTTSGRMYFEEEKTHELSQKYTHTHENRENVSALATTS